MFLTLEKLRSQIQLARRQLIDSATLWLDSKEQLSKKIKTDWLAACSSDTRKNMQTMLQERNLPFVRVDSIVDQSPLQTPDVESTELVELSVNEQKVREPNSILKSTYVLCNKSESKIFAELCRLTNLMDQLLLLEQMTAPIESFPHIKPLCLAESMAESISREWCFAEAGIGTVNFYSNRYDIAMQQYNYAKKMNLEALSLLEEQLEFRQLQFAETLNLFSDTLSAAYASVEDNRYWITRAISAYLPWHAMLNQLAINLFEKDGVTHPTYKLLNLDPSRKIAMNELVVAEHKKPIEQLSTEHNEKCKKIDGELATIKIKLESMASNLETVKLFGQRRKTALLLMPTPLLGMMGLFQGLSAVYRIANDQQQDFYLQDGKNTDSEEEKYQNNLH